MNKVTGKLLVFFEEPFWVGIFERIDNGRLSVCKVTFGAEPKDYEVQEFILENYDKLKFSTTVVEVTVKKEIINPKRRQREVRKQMDSVGIGTKSQQALKLQHEQSKTIQKILSREQKEEELNRRFAKKQQKRKEKHKGR